MAADTKALTKDWIQYLKNNKIVELKSDPETGKLQYNRPVTSDDVFNFLDVKTNYSPEDISNALHMVLTRKAVGKQSPKLQQPGPKEPGRDLSTWMYYGMRPGEHPTKRLDTEPSDTPRLQGQEKGKLRYDPDSVSDIDFKEIPPEDPRRLSAPTPNEPERKPKFKLRKVKEDITDEAGYELDEKDVEMIFNMLASGAASKADQEKKSASKPKKDKEETSPEEQQAKKEEDLRKLKRIIRDVMTDSQRKSLWRMLKDEVSLTESQINNSDIKAILQTAADTRNKPSGFGKLFKGLRKDKIDVADLHQAWKDSGFPDDTRDITALLLKHGFSQSDIKKVFSQVFGTYKKGDVEEPDIPQQSPTMMKILQYAKKNNLVQELISFMEQEYGFKESVSSEKLMIEDIRKLFTAMVQENRSERAELIKQEDRVHLGRTKK